MDRRRWLVVLVPLVGLVAWWWGGVHAVTELLAALRDAGPVGLVGFAGVYVLVTLSGAPASLLTLGAGAVWGPLTALAVVWPAATVGAAAAFLLARTVLRAPIAARVAASPKLAALDAALGEEGFTLVALLRLSPVFPFNLLNYGLGVTGVSMRDYTAATALGILPGTAMYVWLGSTLGDVAVLASGQVDAGRGGVALRAVGLVATVALTVVITRRARAALDARLPPEAP